MALIRDVRSHPWMHIVAVACLAAPPLLTAIYLPPDWHGARADVSIAIWLDLTLQMTASSFCVYSFAVTWRKRLSIEDAFLILAIMARSFLDLQVRTDLDPGVSLAAALLSDWKGLLLSAATIAVALRSIAFARAGDRTERPSVDASTTHRLRIDDVG